MLALLLRWLHRPCVRMDVTPLPAVKHILTSYVEGDWELEIHCECRHYRYYYAGCPLPGSRHGRYRLTARVSDSAPAMIRLACTLKLCVSPVFGYWLTEYQQRSIAVQHYLDELQEELRALRVKPPKI